MEDISELIRDSFYDTMQENRKELLNQILILLYRHHTDELEKDLIKCITMKPEYEPTHQERLHMLMWMFPTLEFVFREPDYSSLLDKVREMNKLHATMASYGDDVPFV